MNDSSQDPQQHRMFSTGYAAMPIQEIQIFIKKLFIGLGSFL